MKTDLPTPEDMLEELADRAAATIDRNAAVAFDRALEEMTDYHRFLLALNAPDAKSGSAFSLAEVGGPWSPHVEWAQQYARLYERASERIPDNTHYIRKLAYSPLGLLPRKQDPRLSPGVSAGILDLGPNLVYRLEAWFTRRTVVADNGEGGAKRMLLAGSDERAYADALTDVVGGWESLHQFVPEMVGWRRGTMTPAAREWDRLRDTWLYLFHHLKNTARMVAIAAWNEDEKGAAMFGEAFVRWPGVLEYELGDGTSLFYRRMLYPPIIALDWDAARKAVASLQHGFDRAPPPRELFANTLQSVYGDVRLVTAALLLHWTVSGRQQTDIAARTAMSLLGVVDTDSGEISREPANLEFIPLCLALLRLKLAGSAYDNESYGTELDSFVRRMDGMTERPVVPGRSFTPSTLHGRDELVVSFLALLAMDVRPADEAIGRRFSELARDDSELPNGQESLVGILEELGHLLRGLDSTSNRLHNALRIVATDERVEKVVDRLRAKLEAAIAAVQAARDDHLRAAEIDVERLNPIRAAITEKLLTLPFKGTLFRGVSVDVVTDGHGPRRDVKLIRLEKARLIDPSPSMLSNLGDVTSRFVKRQSDGYLWRDFAARKRFTYTVSKLPNDALFWWEIGDLAHYIGPDPILIVSDDETKTLRELIAGRTMDSSEPTIEQKPAGEKGRQYLATVNGVDVYSSEMSPRKAWLFSARTLERVRYIAPGGLQSVVTLSMQWQDNGLEGDLFAHFQQLAEWAEFPTIEVVIPDPSNMLVRGP
ncbi:hypothetical protein [Lysobacter sp. M15]|uniref:hypothetical protein n=1 Tax=Lysobacter sp. M15 TaxID=2916837 RepID=UPI001F59AD35|nr:hypothetical protein [Lysobacter sp. M15]